MKIVLRKVLFALPGLAVLILSLFADVLQIGNTNGVGTTQIAGIVVGILMMMLGVIFAGREASSNPGQQLSLKKKLVFSSCVVSCIMLILLVGFGIYESHRIYTIVTSKVWRGWIGSPHQPDRLLGYKAVSNGRGQHTFSIGPNIPMRYDSLGFRVPVDTTNNDRSQLRPTILFLGCSFTYGDACIAEETFPELVGQMSGGTALNAGKCSYGLGQMVFLARRLVSKFTPDFVVVQYSPWLIDRAMNPFMPSYFGRAPGPYYANNNKGELVLQPPLFRSMLYELPFDKFKGPSNPGFMAFCNDVGAPLLIHDAWNMTRYRIQSMFGLVPAPTTDKRAVIRNGYEEIFNICRKNEAQIVLLVLGRSENRIEIPTALPVNEILIVDAQKGLIDRLEVGQKYQNAYAHWRGNPEVYIDGHPNAHAHSIIADELMSVISSK